MDYIDAVVALRGAPEGSWIEDNIGRQMKLTDGETGIEPVGDSLMSINYCWTCGSDWRLVTPDPELQYDPDNVAFKADPELLTMAQAIHKAVEMGGGEVVNTLYPCVSAIITKSLGFISGHTLAKGAESSKKTYTVRPLPPEDFGWDEAWEKHLSQGKPVRFNGGNGRATIKPEFVSDNVYDRVIIKTLKDKRFTAVEEK